MIGNHKISRIGDPVKYLRHRRDGVSVVDVICKIIVLVNVSIIGDLRATETGSSNTGYKSNKLGESSSQRMTIRKNLRLRIVTDY